MANPTSLISFFCIQIKNIHISSSSIHVKGYIVYSLNIFKAIGNIFNAYGFCFTPLAVSFISLSTSFGLHREFLPAQHVSYYNTHEKARGQVAYKRYSQDHGCHKIVLSVL